MNDKAKLVDVSCFYGLVKSGDRLTYNSITKEVDAVMGRDIIMTDMSIIPIEADFEIETDASFYRDTRDKT